MISGPLSRGLFQGEEMRLYIVNVDDDSLSDKKEPCLIRKNRAERVKEILSRYRMDKV